MYFSENPHLSGPTHRIWVIVGPQSLEALSGSEPPHFFGHARKHNCKHLYVWIEGRFDLKVCGIHHMDCPTSLSLSRL